jgi:hypothetical protein
MSVSGEEPGMTPEEIAADYDLPLAAVREAIQYGESNPHEIQQDWQADEVLAAARGMSDSDARSPSLPRILSPSEMARLRPL